MQVLTQDLMGYADLAKLLNIKTGTIYSWVSRGLIPHVRLGPRVVRFSRAQIEEWLASRVVPAGMGASARSVRATH